MVSVSIVSDAHRLREELQRHLEMPDPQHGYGLFNITSAAKWFNELPDRDQELLVDYLVRELKSAAKCTIGELELMIMLAETASNSSFSRLVDALTEHGERIVRLCARAKLSLK